MLYRMGGGGGVVGLRQMALLRKRPIAAARRACTHLSYLHETSNRMEQR